MSSTHRSTCARRETHAQSETQVKLLHQAGDLSGAATLTLRLYGAQVLRFLAIRVRSHVDRDDVFSQFCEDFWCGFAHFDWRCALRTWLFTLAHHARVRLLGAAHRRREVYSRALESDALANSEAQSSEARHLCAEVQERVRELRRALPDSQQTLLALRVDQTLSWQQLAVTLRDVPRNAEEPELQRAAARVRARFGAVKRRLRSLAEQDGLLRARA
ncbi:MAG TPA: sigma-70 family RNA polymerase sigma factor [Polyangiaceae bacterium]|nr:sigma-70 family RNA polymerase sigma factor [Polyangiaceae bacterium]